MKHLTTVPFLIAALLFSAVPVSATPPNFNGNLTAGGKPWYDVTFYGAKCNATGDDTAAIQSAINAAEATTQGGVVRIPVGTCLISATLNVTSDNVEIVGGSQPGFFQYPGTTLKWVGTCSSSATIIQFYPTGARAIEASGMQNIYFDPNGSTTPCAGIALITNSVMGGDWEHLTFGPFSNVAWKWTTTPGLTGGGNDMHNYVRQIVLNNYWNAGSDIVLSGNSTISADDSASNTFIDVFAVYNNGNGLDIQNADHNHFVNIHAFLNPGGTGTGLVFNCGSRYNEVIGDAAATTSVGSATCSGGAAGSPANHNRVELFDSSDIPAGPTTQVGATLDWVDQTGTYSISSNTPFNFTSTSGNTITESTTGANVPLTFNATGAPSGNLAQWQLGGVNKLTIGNDGSVVSNGAVSVGNIPGNKIYVSGGSTTLNAPSTNGIAFTNTTNGVLGTIDGSGNLTMTGRATGNGHNTCGTNSGVPCTINATCSLTAATTCNATVTVPASSQCVASANSTDTTTGVESWKTSLSTNTLTVTVIVGSSQTSSASAVVHCL